MKIAVSASGPELSSPVDARFGRAPWFIIMDVESGVWEAAENKQNLQAAQGAGVQSAECVANRGVEAVLTGHCGPKAFRALSAAGMKVHTGVTGSVSDAVARFKAGELGAAEQADVEGHWA